MPNWKKVLVSGSNAELNQVTASFFKGDGSALTNLPSPPIVTYNDSGDNRIITSVSSDTVQGEEKLTFDGNGLNIDGHVTASGNISGSASTTASFGRVVAADSLTIGGIEVGGHPVIATDSSDDYNYITFVDNVGDGSTAQQLQSDSGLRYRSSDNLLSATASLAKRPIIRFDDTITSEFNVITAGIERFTDNSIKAANMGFTTGTTNSPFTYKPDEGKLKVTAIEATNVNATASLASKPLIRFEDSTTIALNVMAAGFERHNDNTVKAANSAYFYTGTTNYPFTYTPDVGKLSVTTIEATSIEATASLASKPLIRFEDSTTTALNVMAAGFERFSDNSIKAASSTTFYTGTTNNPFTYTPDPGKLNVNQIEATNVYATASLASKPLIRFEDSSTSALNVMAAGFERFNDNTVKAANSAYFYTGTTSYPFTYTPDTGQLDVTQIQATNVYATASLAKKPLIRFEDSTTSALNILTAGFERFADNTVKASNSAYFYTGTTNRPFTYQPSTGTVVASVFDGNLSGNATTATTAGTATKVTVTNNSSTDESNVLTFVANADNNGGNVDLESNANLTFNPSTGRLSATELAGDGSNITNLPSPPIQFLENVGNDRILRFNTSSNNNTVTGDANLTFDGSTLAVGGAVTISGNLSVSGTTTTVNSTQVDIGDKILTLNAGSAAGDGGIYVNDADTAETGSLLWDVSEDRWIGGLKDNEVKLVTLDSTDTLTNKTLTAPVITTIVPASNQTLTLPSTTGTLARTSDNVASATVLANARTIGGVSFDGSQNIDLPGVNQAGTQDTSGNADTATKIASITNSDIVQLTSTQTLTNKTLTSPVLDTGVSGTAIKDEDNMESDSNTHLATQQSIKAYVDNQLTAQDLDIEADSGGALSIDLDSETLTIAGGTGIDTSGNTNTITIDIDSTVTTLTGEQTLTNKTLTTPIITSISNSGTISIPSGNDTLVGRDTTDTLTNKTLTNPVISTIVNSGNNLTLPTTADTIVGRATTDTLTNKTLHNPVVTGTLNVTSSIVYEGATDNDFETTLTVTDPTGDRTITLPDVSGTVSLIGASETLTNKTLTSPVLNGTLSGTAFLDEDDFSSDSNVAVASQQSIKAYVDAQVTAQDLDLTSDDGTIDIDLDSETLTIAGGTGINSSATSTTLTVAIDNTVTTLAGEQTLTNKTLTTPIISSISNTGTLTLPTSTDTLVGRDTTDTLTNKTLTSPDINGGTIDNATIGLTTPTTGNFTHITGSGNVSGSVTSTGSFGRFIGIGNSSIDGNLDIGGILTAKEIHTTFTSASIVFQSGSSKFGDTPADDIHSFTGSLIVTGSVSASADTSASFGHVLTSGNIEALGTGSFRVLNIVEQISSQGRTFSPGYTSTDTNIFVDTTITGMLNVIGSVTASGGISGSSITTGSFGRIETTGTGSFGRVDSTKITGTILTAAQPNITSLGTLSSIDIDGGNIDGATIATSNITVGNSKTLDVSAGTLTTSETQNLNIIQGANSNIDIGTFELRAQTLVSDVSTGTAPFTVSSTTAVSNLNADLLDGNHGSHYTDFTNMTVEAGEVTNAMLENNSISFGGVSVDLGSSNDTPAFDLQSATNYPGDSSLVTTGTVTTGVWNSTFGTNAGGYISGSLSKAHLSTKVPGIISGSEQLEDNISGSLSKVHLSSKVPNIVSGSEQIADNISGSLGPNATFLRGLTAVSVSGSFNSVSSSIATDISNATASINSLVNNNTEDVTLVTTSHDYLSISGQTITLNTVDIGDDTNLTGGTNITLDGDTLNVDDAFLINSGNDSTSGTITAAGFIATGNISGSVTATGSFGRIETAGNLVPKAHNTSDLGSSTNRWANIYSADLQLSNMDNDEGNEVDGTKGSWTIQEGEDDLYLLNRKNGKKYKFKLEEIT